MSDISQELITLLQFLLPGLLSAWVYYGLTPYSEPTEFERVVQALILTLLVQAVAFPMSSFLLWLGKWCSIGTWDKNSELTLSVICAFLVGVIISYFSNNDHFHRAMRILGITRETSYPSEWFGAFNNSLTYVVLHLENGTRIYGWPLEWPSEPGNGHFVLVEASWLNDDNSQIELVGVSSVLIRSQEVRVVEFVELNRSVENEKGSESTSTDAITA